jgi:hypothetical protein
MGSINRSTVSGVQDLRLIGPGRVIVPLTAGLFYSSQDPYAVRLSFDAGQEEPVEWTFGRDLLAAALHGPEGMGDVRVWPSAASVDPAEAAAGAGERILNIVLGPPTGYARFEASAAGIGAFLAQTFELVPAGREPDCFDLDAEIIEFLSQA